MSEGRLWTLTKFDEATTLPVLLREGMSFASTAPYTKGVKVYSDPRSIQTMNPISVVMDFPWTKTPSSARYDTPSITLTEKRLLMNSTISNIANSLFAGGQYIPGTTNIEDLIQNLIEGESAQVIQQLNRAQANSTSNIRKKSIGAVKDFISNVWSGYKVNDSVLKPYSFLYSTENTGFQYILPYFNNTLNNNSNSFGEDEYSSFIKGSVGELSDLAASIMTKAFGGFKPGIYIEKSKQYSMGNKGRTIEIKFPLLNTGKYEDILMNWQLIYGLIYQNRPGRVTRSVIDMPVIYEVLSEGVVYMPFAYINSLSVNFLGARRKMLIEVPVFNSNDIYTPIQIQTIVPDAYEISISLEGMNEETRNFMYASTAKTVTVGAEFIQ